MTYRPIDYKYLLNSDPHLLKMTYVAIAAGYGIDASEVSVDGSGIPEDIFQWSLQDNPLGKAGSEFINVVLGRHHFCSLFPTPEEIHNMGDGDTWVVEKLRNRLRETIHQLDPCLSRLTDVVRYTYSKLRTDNRPDGTYAFLGKQPVCIRKKPKFITDLSGCGNQVSDVDLSNALYRVLPDSTIPQVYHLIQTFKEMWAELHGGQKALIYMTNKQVMSGEKLYITVKNGRCGVVFQFNRVGMIDKNTLKPHAEFISALREFGDE